ncbi:hypothetical protein QUF72_09790 [Desulfobacterales bacterium HSG2]|nr:hypothetical protein [Desulfobacterales bacterium HSG2]
MDSRVRGNDSKGRRQTPRCHSCGSRNPLPFKQWIPAFAGMTARGKWIPAFAGMTAKAAVKRPAVIPAEAGIHSLTFKQWIPAFAGMTARGQMDSRVRGNNSKGRCHSTPPFNGFPRSRE